MSSRDEIMQRWDAWREYIAEGGKASWPRDEFENALDSYADEQVEACVAALKKELHLWLPENRMQHIEDVCRSASLTKRGK